METTLAGTSCQRRISGTPLEILVTDQSADSSLFASLCSFVVVAQLAVGEELGGGVEGGHVGGVKGLFVPGSEL